MVTTTKAPPSPVERLPEIFRDKARQLTDAGFGLGADIWRQAAKDAELALMEESQQLLTVNEGVRISGYARRTLDQYLADGTLANHGKPGAPRIRRGDLPRKANHKPGRNGRRRL